MDFLPLESTSHPELINNDDLLTYLQTEQNLEMLSHLKTVLSFLLLNIEYYLSKYIWKYNNILNKDSCLQKAHTNVQIM